jgi:phosphoserine phosphatase
MDPVFFDILAKFGIGAALVWWFARRDDRNRDEAVTREAAAAKKCADEAEAMRQRVQVVEDRQYNVFSEILKATSEALKTNAHAFDKMVQTETDKFRALEPKDRHP